MHTSIIGHWWSAPKWKMTHKYRHAIEYRNLLLFLPRDIWASGLMPHFGFHRPHLRRRHYLLFILKDKDIFSFYLLRFIYWQYWYYIAHNIELAALDASYFERQSLKISLPSPLPCNFNWLIYISYEFVKLFHDDTFRLTRALRSVVIMFQHFDGDLRCVLMMSGFLLLFFCLKLSISLSFLLSMILSLCRYEHAFWFMSCHTAPFWLTSIALLMLSYRVTR